MNMKVRPLDDREQEGMSAERAWVDGLLASAGATVRLTGSRADIPTLHTLLDRGPFTDDAAAELQIFGGAFGDIIAKELKMTWVVVEDEAGVDLALQYGTYPVFVFPRTMLLKRIQGGERVQDVNLEVILQHITKSVAEQLKQCT